MKKILGLDIGTASIGWAMVNEASNEKGKSSIIKTGVRIVLLSTDESSDFAKGKAISINADRTLKRGARRNLQRYKLRRKNLIEILLSKDIITDGTILSEEGKGTTHSIWGFRARAASEEIDLADFGRVLLSMNKKRGYKSNRKAKDEADGKAIDGMEVAKKLYSDQLTPGQYALNLLNQDKKYLPDFYRSDLQAEFDKVWECQKKFHPEEFTDEMYLKVSNRAKKVTTAIYFDKRDIETPTQQGKPHEKMLEAYEWRSSAIDQELSVGRAVFVLAEINKDLSKSSGYLGAISDRSKQLIFNAQTVGQYLYKQLEESPHSRLKNQVFYRQDYLDEFERIWEMQSKTRKDVLTDQLKTDIRDVIIFYQRRLKSQKGLISICEMEGKEKEIVVDGKKKLKVIGPNVIPKSSPLFQEFKIWQRLNDLEFTSKVEKKKSEIADMDEDMSIRRMLFNELNLKGELSDKQILKLVFPNPKDWELNFEEVEGNRTNEVLFKAYLQIAEMHGHDIDSKNVKSGVSEAFETLGIKKRILDFDAELGGREFERQPAYQLWHLLYSYEGDNSNTGNDKLFHKLQETFGFERAYAQQLVNLTFQNDYGNLSTKAIRKILRHLKEGKKYAEACEEAGYNHSHALTKEENEKRKLAERLKPLAKNSLRNPVVEKILNQMVNVVNAVIDEYGKPDEIRIELARELKKSAKEREDMTRGISESTRRHEAIRSTIKELYPFNSGVRITHNDVLKYKLYEELSSNGHKTLYTNIYIPLEKLFTKDFEIEHIIPKAILFNDSFSNKTLSVSEFNRAKGNKTGYDAVAEKYGEESDGFRDYLERIERLFKGKKISKTKYNNLLMKGDEIPDGFIDRDLRNTQYIAKKALQMLHQVVRTVTPTTGSITGKLREDWQLVDVMQELNWDKYKKLGLTTTETNKHGDQIGKIVDWTKRNDHRHHAMDALTVAFTKLSYVQYFNNLNARKDEDHKQHKNIQGIEEKETYKNDKNKRLINPPIPIAEFRAEAKKHLESILISVKAKNKVVTRNKNQTNKKSGANSKIELTPRGQLHKETVYGQSSHYETWEEKAGIKFDVEKINSVAKKAHREALLNRLQEFDNDPKKAFTGKNSLAKNPIYLDEHQSEKLPERVTLVSLKERYTIRKDISPDLKLDKVIDLGIRHILQKRLDESGGDQKKAFSNLEENPIWLDKEKGIQIKRVKIKGVSSVKSLHYKKNHHGNEILDKGENPIAVDFVSTGNNHHVAIYKDEEGRLHEEVVSFYDAVTRVNAGVPIIWKDHPEYSEFLFTMKQNEYFIFPNEETGFDPKEIDLTDPANCHRISPNLFRVQKITIKNYVLRHHLETTVDEIKSLKGVSYIKITSTDPLSVIVKVRLNHLGQIIKVGE